MFDKQIQMVDLHSQYIRLKDEIDAAMQAVLDSTAFINGPQVRTFSDHLGGYLQIPNVIPCGNGTDALQIALMALDLQPGDEVIIPDFTYVAAAEVIALLGMIPVLVDVDPRSFNLDSRKIEEAISRNTKAIIAVHLFGQSCDMEPILKIAEAYHLYVIEDNAQSVGAEYTYSDGRMKKTGTMGHIGTTSFFPSKPLACFGDGGALMCSDDTLAERIRRIANHGQVRKYHHKLIGCNSRLDSLQAAILDVKLKHLDEFTASRRDVAVRYNEGLAGCEWIDIPKQSVFSTHIYHQYTVQLKSQKGADPIKKRTVLQEYLKAKGVPSMVYYPLPLHTQEAYRWMVRIPGNLGESTRLSTCVLSIPIHTEMSGDEQKYIIETLAKAPFRENE